MRTLMIATAGMALMAASGATAEQRVVAHGPGVPPRMTPMMHNPPMMHHAAPTVQVGGSRWGSKVGGHWWGGMNAPGGWQAYRRPARGYVLPSYWISPRFYITDWSGYGLSQPATGYNWVRYYDDAVLIDGRGSVYDTADGIDWDRYDDGYYTDDTRVYAGSAERGRYRGDGAGVPVAPDYGARYDARADRQRRDNDGVVGAAVGGVVGGVAGNAIAGRGDKLGGTLIGAGVGAAAGYAVGSASGKDRRYASRPGYPPQAGYAPPPPPPPAYAPPPAYPQGYDARYRDQRRGSDGLAGAAVGGVVGGVAGNVIAGRGNRLGGTLIGAGVGAAAGYAIDRASDDKYHRQPPVAPDYGTPYRDHGGPDRGYHGGWRHDGAPGGTTVTSNGGTVVTTTATGGYAAGGYYYPAGSTTTVVVQQAPIVTTTTTEIYEDTVTYVKPRPVRRTKIVKRWRAPAKCSCR